MSSEKGKIQYSVCIEWKLKKIETWDAMKEAQINILCSGYIWMVRVCYYF